jgi:deoxyribose-phosphate aldolase
MTEISNHGSTEPGLASDSPLGSGPESRPAEVLPRNPGAALDLGWIQGPATDENEVEQAVDSLVTRGGIREEEQARWLMKAVSCIDLTTLSGDDTPARVRRLCSEARNPVHPDILEALGVDRPGPTTASVCVYHEMLETALESLEGSGIPVAVVSAGFPHGLSPLAVRLAEIEASVSAGAGEIDAVIPRFLVLQENWERLYEQVSAYRRACGEAHLKVILSTGELGSLEKVFKASMVCMMAGADFIKTSTGKEVENATLPVGLVMARAIEEYGRRTGFAVGLKPAGGIREASEALAWLGLADQVLGGAWTEKSLFRFGASSLLANVKRELERLASLG